MKDPSLIKPGKVVETVLTDEHISKGRAQMANNLSEKDRTDQAALVGVALAGALATTLSPGLYGWFSTVVGVTLLLVLLAYYRPTSPYSVRKSAALGAVSGICVILALGWLIQLPFTHGVCGQISNENRFEACVLQKLNLWLLGAWLVAAGTVTATAEYWNRHRTRR
jgi:uncharacterized membrane protein